MLFFRLVVYFHQIFARQYSQQALCIISEQAHSKYLDRNKINVNKLTSKNKDTDTGDRSDC